MGWNLEIHTIDVAQGESSLLIASNDDTGQIKSMLIDGGLQRYGRLVHNYVKQVLPTAAKLDVMVTTHYDEDHSEGQISILLADNLSNVASFIGNTVADNIASRRVSIPNQFQLAAVGAGAFGAVIAGAYGTGAATLALAINYVLTNWASGVGLPTTAVDAVEYGLFYGLRYMETIPNDQRAASLMKNQPSGDTLQAAIATVGAVMGPLPIGFTQGQAATKAYFELVAPQPTVTATTQKANKNYGFYTANFYAATRVFNIGNPVGIPTNNNVQAYSNAVIGKVKIFACDAKAPTVTRNPRVPALGQELWGIADTTAPRVYCVSVLGNVLYGAGPVGGDALNKVSIGLAVVFNQFVYFTGGDLTVSGLDMIPNAVIDNPTMGRPATIPVYKAGHHGSSESNSAEYLELTGTRCSFISSGSKSFGVDNTVLPTQAVIDMFNESDEMDLYFMTNCKVLRDGVPATNAENQLDDEDNRSRLAGDNEFDQGEKAPAGYTWKRKQSRGDIVLYISQEESQSTILGPDGVLDDDDVYRQFRVSYWEEDIPDNAIDAIGTRQEIIYF